MKHTHRIKEIKDKYKKKFLNKKNVIGVGIGEKIKGDLQTGEEAITVFVKKKVPIEELSPDDLLPKEIQEKKVDVIELGHVKKLTPEHERKYRPILGGISVGHKDITAGTLGLVVRKKGDSVNQFILSNNHVLANSNNANIGDPIYQPGPYDGGNFIDKVGELDSFVSIKFDGSENEVDAALASISVLSKAQTLEKKSFFKWLWNLIKTLLGLKEPPIVEPPIDQTENLSEILNIGVIYHDWAPVEINDMVKKSGRTTGVTYSNILAVDADIVVDYGPDGEALFVNQIVAGYMSEGGDSGSIVLNYSDKITGLLFAGSDVATIINPINKVIEKLNIDISNG